MSRLKVAVCAVALNQAPLVERFMTACAEADLVVVGDAGSTDETPTLLRGLGATVQRITVEPWRFDLARNAVMALVPGNFDVCVKLDLDEMLVDGWRGSLESVWRPDVTRFRYEYAWSGGGVEADNVAFWTDNIHARAGYRWIFPCCEVLSYYDSGPECVVDVPGLRIRQVANSGGSGFDQLGLLNLAVRENSYSDRLAFFYGRELYFNEHWELAGYELERYLSLPTAAWTTERSQAMILLARCCQALEQPDLARHWLLRAVAECPSRREVWCELAQDYHNQQQWGQCYSASLEALRILQPDRTYVIETRVWGALPHDLAAVAAFQLGLYEAAREQGQRAAELEPDDQRLRENLGFYTARLTPEPISRARRGRRSGSTG